MYFVYVIRSLKNDSFYIGRTANLSERLNFHNSTDKNVGVTRMNIPWEYFFVLEVKNSTIASKIERHIKRMKSTVYLKNLVKYPEIGARLIEKYS